MNIIRASIKIRLCPVCIRDCLAILTTAFAGQLTVTVAPLPTVAGAVHLTLGDAVPGGDLLIPTHTSNPFRRPQQQSPLQNRKSVSVCLSVY